MYRLDACTVGLLLLPWIADATELRSSDQVVVGKDEVITGDFYASGATVIVDGVVLGDVVAAGREVSLNGRVAGDFIAAGQIVVLRGVVGDDARIASTVLHLGGEATINDHLVAAGYSFEAEPGSRVGGEVFFAGAKARVAGAFESRLRLAATAVEIEGSVAGDAEVELSGGSLEGSSWFEGFFSGSMPPPPVTDGLSVNDSAHIGGRLSYVSPAEVEVPDVAVGGVQWKQQSAAAEPEAAEATRLSRGVDQLRRFATLLIFGLVLLWRAPAWVSGRGNQLRAEPLKSLGRGVAGLAGLPVAAFAVLLVTVVLAIFAGTLSLGGLVALFLLVGLAVLIVLLVGFVIAGGFTAQVLVSTAAGRAALRRARPGHASGRWLPLILGLSIYALVTGVSYVGPVIALLVAALGLGSIGQWLFSVLRHGWEVGNG